MALKKLHTLLSTAPRLAMNEVSDFTLRPLPFAHYYDISIADNGIGFNQQYADHVFEIFKFFATEVIPVKTIVL